MNTRDCQVEGASPFLDA